jgi:nucleoid-associated protein YgaU
MDMGKYVAVGVLAVIVLAAVTYEPPKDKAAAGTAQAPATSGDGLTVEGAFGAAAPPAAPAAPETRAPAPRVEVAPITSASPAPETSRSSAPGASPTSPVATSQPASAPRGGELLTYTIKAGQTLCDAAEALLGDRGRWHELYVHNKDKLPDPDRVRAGLTLVFPREAATTKAAAAPRDRSGRCATAADAPVATAPAGGGHSYTVQKGDTLYSIARKQLGNGGRWRELVSLNHLRSETVVVGTTIALPAR